ncbi:hypothetical protein T02_10171 [Trichinella nativa]|uniref:Uncharacterized protein n=1 Tax=Trichinella nativa TaxID=6335 RepID=A0A0V1L602_9BILA|nr:hypothetical protein T02_10171 [Trichinella nativa]
MRHLFQVETLRFDLTLPSQDKILVASITTEIGILSSTLENLGVRSEDGKRTVVTRGVESFLVLLSLALLYSFLSKVSTLDLVSIDGYRATGHKSDYRTYLTFPPFNTNKDTVH